MTRYQFPDGFLGRGGIRPANGRRNRQAASFHLGQLVCRSAGAFLSAGGPAGRLRYLPPVSAGRGVDEADRLQLLSHLDSVVAADRRF